MSDGRRNELLVALNAEFPALFTFCYKVLEGNFVRYKQAPDAGVRQRSRRYTQTHTHTHTHTHSHTHTHTHTHSHTHTHGRLVAAALKTFEAYAPLSSLAVLCQCGAHSQKKKVSVYLLYQSHFVLTY